jgi:hypothetical protein
MCKARCDRTYNGWTNYETWVVNLWMDNEKGQQDYWIEEVRDAMRDRNPVACLADRIRESHGDASADMLKTSHFDAGPFADLLNGALSEVNWREIAQHWIDDHAADAAGREVSWRDDNTEEECDGGSDSGT